MELDQLLVDRADDGLDVYQVMENMGRRGWSLNGLQRPAAVHIAVTLRHTLPGVADRFLDEYRAAVVGMETASGPISAMRSASGAKSDCRVLSTRQKLHMPAT